MVASKQRIAYLISDDLLFSTEDEYLFKYTLKDHVLLLKHKDSKWKILVFSGLANISIKI